MTKIWRGVHISILARQSTTFTRYYSNGQNYYLRHGMVDHREMKAYSEDVRHKVVQAVEQRGTSKSQAARLFGISLSSVKRYTRLAGRGESLTPRKGGGRPPKADETTKRLLEEDIRTRPAATVNERRNFLDVCCKVFMPTAP